MMMMMMVMMMPFHSSKGPRRRYHSKVSTVERLEAAWSAAERDDIGGYLT